MNSESTSQTHPLISFNGWNGVCFATTAAYIELRGFSILGNNYNMTLDAVLRQKDIATAP